MTTTVMFVAVLLLPIACFAAEENPPSSPFVEKEIIFTGGPYKEEKFRYMLLEPEMIEPGKKYPIILFLHGSGERGSDPHKALADFPSLMAKPEYRKRFPCFLVVPQCREGKTWVKVKWSDKTSSPISIRTLSDDQHGRPVSRTNNGGESRRQAASFYLTGLSMGGFGSWDLAMRRPELFAAVVPICGGGDEKEVGGIVHLPIWAFHGSVDQAVPVERSRQMIDALEEEGGVAEYTEYTSW